VGLSQLLSRARGTFAAPANADDRFCLALDTEILISFLLADDEIQDNRFCLALGIEILISLLPMMKYIKRCHRDSIEQSSQKSKARAETKLHTKCCSVALDSAEPSSAMATRTPKAQEPPLQLLTHTTFCTVCEM
jgi:hypothetical protein